MKVPASRLLPLGVALTLFGTAAPAGAWVLGNDQSHSPAISADGRYVAFVSDATNLVSGDTNNRADIFRLDRLTGTVQRASLKNDGGQSTAFSSGPAISGDGRYVAFTSQSALTTDDSNSFADIFVRDMVANTTRIVSKSTAGGAGNGISQGCAITSDGQKVLFSSAASNLIAGDTNGSQDVFLKDLQTGVLTRVSETTGGAPANSGSGEPALSADGRFAAFSSSATNLLPSDTTSLNDIYLRDLVGNTLTLISVNTTGGSANGSGCQVPSVSADGTRVAFYSDASNLVGGDTNGGNDVFVRDTSASITLRASLTDGEGQASSESGRAMISADGNVVAFESLATNLVSGDTNGFQDIFVRDLAAGTTVRASVATDGAQGNSVSRAPSISADGREVAFYSSATNLIPGDTNGADDVFTRDVPAGTTTIPVTVSAFGVE